MFIVRRSTVIALASVTLVLMAGCATTSRSSTTAAADRGSLSSAADRLAANTNTFAQATDNAPGLGRAGDNSATRDARSLADQAQDFRRAAASNADQQDLKAAFDELSRTYQTVKEEVDHSDSQWTKNNWRSVSAAYADLANQIYG